MKKFLVLLVVLAMVAITSPLYAGDNVTIGGEFTYVKDSANVDGTFTKAELNISSMVGDYSTVELELDSEGDDWAGTGIDHDSDPDTDDWGMRNVAVDDFRLKTDIFGALGLELPVTLNTTIGYFDTYFTGWKYVSDSGWDFYYGNWTISGNSLGPVALGAIQADIGVGPVTISYASDFEFQTLRFGASGSFGPVGFYASFGAASSAIGDGVINVQADYSGSFGDLSLYVPAHFGYDIGKGDLWVGGGAKVDYTSLVHLAVGFDYATNDGVADSTKMVIDLSSKPIGDLGIGVSAFMDFANDAFTGLDAHVNYMFGATMLQVGFAYTVDDDTTIPIIGDNGSVKGLYIAADIDF
jgi:hypothetical protein